MSGEKKRKRPEGSADGKVEDLYFQGISAHFIETEIQLRRLQIWKQKLEQLGGVVEEQWSKHLTHVFAASVEMLTQKLGSQDLGRKKMVCAGVPSPSPSPCWCPSPNYCPSPCYCPSPSPCWCPSPSPVVSFSLFSWCPSPSFRGVPLPLPWYPSPSPVVSLSVSHSLLLSLSATTPPPPPLCHHPSTTAPLRPPPPHNPVDWVDWAIFEASKPAAAHNSHR